jgi:predicted amino acid-binding ACT domain protein
MLTDFQIEVGNIIATKAENVKLDEMGVTFDFATEIGVYYNISDILDLQYKDDITLIVTLVGIKEKKIDMQTLAKEIDSILHKANLQKGRIVRQSNYYQSFIDEDNKNNIVLSYFIYNYNKF